MLGSIRRGALGAALALGSLAPSAARADQFDDANRRLMDLEERVRVLAAEFRDAPANDPNAADRRVLDAELLYNLKNYVEAATICLDVIERYPNSRAYDDAIFLLGESLYQNRDYLSARRYFQQAIQKNTGSRKEQAALNRLIEIALRTNDFEGVDGYLDRLRNIPRDRQDPSVPYVRGKYQFFRDQPDDALATFNAIPPTSPYHLQARYFIGTIQVKKGDLAAAVEAFDTVLRQQPRNDDDKEIQDLARMAIGRVHYERGQFDKAKEAYSTVPRQSKYFGEAMYESTWNSIKAKDFVAAYRSLDIMLLQNPDSPQAPELRILRGNLHLRLANFFLAAETFTQTREEFEPIYKQVQTNAMKSSVDPNYFTGLLGKGLEKFDIAAFVPGKAVNWVRAEPDVAKLLALADDVGGLQRDLKDSENTIQRLERAISGEGRVGIFADLASARGKSIEILNQMVEVRRRFIGRMRALIKDALSGQDRAELDQIAAERASLDAQLGTLPTTAEALRKREKSARGAVGDLDARSSELYVMLQGMAAELVAIEQYYVKSRAEQKIRPEELATPVQDLRREIELAQQTLEQMRIELTEASRDFGAAGAAAASERNAVVRLAELMKREQAVFQRARGGLSGSDQGEFDRISGVLARADGVQSRLAEFDGRVDAVAERRLGEIRTRILAEKAELGAASGKLTGVLTESQSVGGGLVQVMLSRVQDRFYDLVVQSDVGLVDVSWGLKDQKTQNLSKLINQQKLELKAIDDDFKSLLEEEKQ